MGIGQFPKVKGLFYEFETALTLKNIAKVIFVELCKTHFFLRNS